MSIYFTCKDCGQNFDWDRVISITNKQPDRIMDITRNYIESDTYLCVSCENILGYQSGVICGDNLVVRIRMSANRE